MDDFKSSSNEALRENAQAEALKENPRLAKQNPLEFINLVYKKFCENRIDDFPRLCEVTRWQNKLKWDELNQIGKKGKYTDSMGWSEKGEFKFDYEIPQELYLFMVNLVYSDFWEEANEKVWRKFMKNILRGDDPMETLMKVKAYYGSNSQEGLVLN